MNQSIMQSTPLKYDWSVEEAQNIYNLPFPELIFLASLTHRTNFDPNQVQRSTLLSVKTGGCPENCSYCPQSAHHKTAVEKHPVLPKETVMQKALEAKQSGSTRFCMGAAWREVKDGKDFDHILDLVSSVKELDLEVCCTLGMLTDSQAKRLKDAGCYAYNHNLDTSPEYYGDIITTRVYEDRIRTLKNVRDAGITVCCGGIIGMGEKVNDRLGLLVQLASQNPHPESVPINMLIKIEGTPLSDIHDVDPIEFIRIIATARIMMPQSMVRLSAGRTQMSDECQALCFIAGANSIFAGDKLLTADNPGEDQDAKLMQKLGMKWFELSATEKQAQGKPASHVKECELWVA